MKMRPALEKLGMDAANKLFDKAGKSAPTGEKLYWGTMAADLVMNSLYYAAAANGEHKAVKTTGMGLLAGLGSLFLPKKMGLITAPTTRTTHNQSDVYGLLSAWLLGSGDDCRDAEYQPAAIMEIFCHPRRGPVGNTFCDKGK